MLNKKALAGTAGAPKVFVEDVFSCFLYTGNGSTQTITNNIDLSTKGGLVWLKERSPFTSGHKLYDTQRGTSVALSTNNTGENSSPDAGVTAFNANGFSLSNNNNTSNVNNSTYASWTFRKAEKFFDIVTYTGNGTAGRTVSHNLGSTPGCMIIKRTDTAGDWRVWHRSLTSSATNLIYLNRTDAEVGAGGTTVWNSTDPTSTIFTLGNSSAVNGTGGTYVAYLFAHNAGGFGDAGSDNVISCGSLTTGSSGYTSVNLGYEPQWVMVKTSAVAGSWIIVDNMRGLPVTGNSPSLSANNLNAEDTARNDSLRPTATGFDINADFYGSSRAFIYIAIRRGPMKTPTSGTSVFSPVASSASTGTTLTTNFPIDMQLSAFLSGYSNNTAALDRLRGVSSTTTETVVRLTTSSTSAESASGIASRNWSNTGFEMPSALGGGSSIFWNFRRAPGFFDVVCWSGNDTARTLSHNLGVTPEMIIAKRRSGTNTSWLVYHIGLNGGSSPQSYYINLNSSGGETNSTTMWNNTAPTSSVFSVGTPASINGSGETYVAYLFSSLSNVSKVGYYTGNGSSITITTNFQPRFVLVKRNDATGGDWIVSDSARGLVAGNDPYLLLNSTAAEDTDEDWVDITSTSFTVNQTSSANANVNTGTYIYLAIA